MPDEEQYKDINQAVDKALATVKSLNLEMKEYSIKLKEQSIKGILRSLQYELSGVIITSKQKEAIREAEEELIKLLRN